ncbi:MAG: hypothetical protein DCC67_11410 [Planctomycetota bacterium]|nr:MAG: hypothetical protein DCC67_11410 [Planctomycetota bacterium]
MRLRVVLLLILGLCAAPLRADFQVGVAKTVITPDPLLPIIGGVGPASPPVGKQGELYARAMVLQQGDVRVAFVQLDLLGFPSVLGARVHQQVPRIKAENILIGSTHTHSAPDCYAFPGLDGKSNADLRYIDFVCDQAAAAINQALDKLQAAHLKIATGEARGKIAYNYYAPELFDPRMSVIQAVSPAGEVIGTLVNYAIHPEVLGSRLGLVSPDLVGPLCDQLEADFGGMGMFINGAQGGMVTADNRILDQIADPLKATWRDARTWEECLRIGRLMASEAKRIVADAPVQQDPALACYARDVKFPVDSDMMWAIVRTSPLKYPHNDDQSITTRINLVNLGDAQILTIPGEALPNIGFFLKRRMKGEHNLLFGLTNDAFGYILTRVDFNSFQRYEYITRTSLGEMTGEILLDNALQMIDEAPAPK